MIINKNIWQFIDISNLISSQKAYFTSNDRWIAYDLLVVMAEIYILSQLSPNCQMLHVYAILAGGFRSPVADKLTMDQS